MSTRHQLSETPIFAIVTGRMVPAHPAVVVSKLPRIGDTFSFGSDRAAVEIVLGFRPGIDRLTVETRGDILLTTEAAEGVIVIDRQHRRIVLQGLTLADMMSGDIESLG